MNGSLPLGVVEGRSAFTDTVRRLILALPEQGPREVWLVDAEFEAWPLDEDGVLDALTLWSRPVGRRLRVIANDFRKLQARFPRFAAWRLPRTHVVESWQPTAEDERHLSAALLAGMAGLELLDARHWRARELLDRSSLRLLQENLSDVLHRCHSAWPSTTLGL